MIGPLNASQHHGRQALSMREPVPAGVFLRVVRARSFARVALQLRKRRRQANRRHHSIPGKGPY